MTHPLLIPDAYWSGEGADWFKLTRNKINLDPAPSNKRLKMLA